MSIFVRIWIWPFYQSVLAEVGFEHIFILNSTLPTRDDAWRIIGIKLLLEASSPLASRTSRSSVIQTHPESAIPTSPSTVPSIKDGQIIHVHFKEVMLQRNRIQIISWAPYLEKRWPREPKPYGDNEARQVSPMSLN